MCTTLQFQQTPANFVPAQLRHDTNGWYLVYYQFNPLLDKLDMKRIKLNLLRRRCRTMVEFKMQVEELTSTINARLRTGALAMQSQQKVNREVYPEIASYDGGDNIRYYKTIEEVTNIFIAEKTKELRETTLRSYKSFCSIFMAWVNTNYPQLKMSMFTKALAIEFMDERAKTDMTPRTYNNTVKLGCTFFSWAMNKCYARENPFMKMEKKRTQKKKRTLIPQNVRLLIDQYFQEHNPAMRIVMRLVYTSLLRPVEISRVQVKQLDFERHCIHMPGDKTKNWDDRDARMDQELEQMLQRHILGAKPDDYLFADLKWRCGKNPMRSHTFSNAWDSMRENLLDDKGKRIVPDEFQLYSLKDTAINGMIKSGVDDLSVMQAAGHKDLKMTQIYADHTDPNLINKLNEQAPKFGGNDKV